MTRPPHEHAAGRSHAGMRMKGAGRERPGREATRESLFMQEHDLRENHALRRKSFSATYLHERGRRTL